jgi:hypothetical protein
VVALLLLGAAAVAVLAAVGCCHCCHCGAAMPAALLRGFMVAQHSTQRPAQQPIVLLCEELSSWHQIKSVWARQQ